MLYTILLMMLLIHTKIMKEVRLNKMQLIL